MMRVQERQQDKQQERQRVIERLRVQIAGVENHLLIDARGNQRRRQLHAFAMDSFSPAPAGLLHEVWSDGTGSGAGAFGFALGQARALLGINRPAILFLQLAREARQTGLPYGPGLYHFGLDPETLIIGRVRNAGELLWATEEAAGCRAVAAIIVDSIHPGKILDFTASRRLAMRAQRHDSSIFLLRYGHGREASASHFRWHVAPALSEPGYFDARTPGIPRWQICLEKGQGVLGNRLGRSRWISSWTENGFVIEQPEKTGKAEKTRAGAALSGPAPAALGHGLSKTA
jgi:protein ImuA